jgi:hypothetical protein
MTRQGHVGVLPVSCWTQKAGDCNICVWRDVQAADKLMKPATRLMISDRVDMRFAVKDGCLDLATVASSSKPT